MNYQIVSVLQGLFSVYDLLIIIWVVMSWIPYKQGGLLDDIARVVSRLVDPYIKIFRNLIPPLSGIDFSPVVAILALQLIERIIISILV